MDDVHSFRLVSENCVVTNILRQVASAGATRVFLLLPNFIDDQWPLAMEVVFGLLGRVANLVVAIPGRNMMICEKGAHHVAYYLAGTGDPSLWVTPREVLAAKAAEVFLETPGVIETTAPPTRRSPTVFVHGCTSSLEKDLPCSLAALIVKELHRSFGSRTSINVGSGIADSTRHREWRRGFTRECGDASPWVLAEDSCVGDLSRRVGASDCVITADTSVAHLGYRHRRGTVCIYNRSSWDARCVGSLFHHSAFGFAYGWPRFFVCISGPMDPAHEARLARSVGRIVEILVGVTSLSALAAQTIQSIADEMESGVREATSPRAVTSKLRHALANLGHLRIRDDPALGVCISDWLRYEEIEPALESDQNTTRELNELLRQFVRLHPVTKLAAMLRTGQVRVGTG